MFDGASFVLNADRSLAVQLPAFREAVVTTRWERGDGGWHCAAGPLASPGEGERGRLRRLHAGPARLCRQERLSRRRARPVRRHRLRRCARRSPSTRSARSACAASCCRIAFTSQDSLDDAAAVARALGVQLRHRCRSRARSKGSEQALGAAVRGPAARHHRGEPAGARARHAADGASRTSSA